MACRVLPGGREGIQHASHPGARCSKTVIQCWPAFFRKRARIAFFPAISAQLVPRRRELSARLVVLTLGGDARAGWRGQAARRSSDDHDVQMDDVNRGFRGAGNFQPAMYGLIMVARVFAC